MRVGMAPWLVLAVYEHPVRSTVAIVGTSLLLLSSVWTGGSGSEHSGQLDIALRGTAGHQALQGLRADVTEGAGVPEFEEEFEAGGNVSVGVCIDTEPSGPDIPNRTYPRASCIEWARGAHCRKTRDFMLSHCIPECRECRARPVCCVGLHADQGECDGELGPLSWGRESAPLEERLLLFPGVRSVVEVGGNTGYDLMMFAQRFPEARIFSFEPVPEFFKVLERLSSGFKPQVTIRNFGLADRNYTAMFTVDGQSSSDISMKGKKQVKAVIRDVDAVLTEVQSELGAAPDAVSLNCEGCEYAVLRRMAKRGWLGTIRFVQLSWHLVVDMADRRDQRCAIERLLRQHYDPVYYSTDFGWQGWRLRGVPGYNTTWTTTAMPDFTGDHDAGAGTSEGES